MSLTTKEDGITLTINLKTVAKSFLAFLLVFAVLIIFFSGKSTPSSGLLYQIKRFQEDSFFKLQTTPESKLHYYDSLLDKRLEELQSLVSAGQINYLWSSSLRYTTTAGRITDILAVNDFPSEKKHFLDKFENHKFLLGEMQKEYLSRYSGDQWKFIQDGVNYLNLYKEKLN